MPEIVVPTLNSLDDDYEVGEWRLADGAEVKRGEVVVVIETTKASVEIEAEHSGALRHLVPAGARCSPGQPVAEVLPPGADGAGRERNPTAQLPSPTELFVTEPARQAMSRLGMSDADITVIGKRVVRREDVETLSGQGGSSAPGPTPSAGPGDYHQHSEAPGNHEAPPSPCYMAAHVDVASARQTACELSRRHKALIGLPEIVLHHIGNCLKDFPALCQGRSTGPITVGVTMDMGKGLFVPVVRDIANQTLPELARHLMALRKAALASKFKPGDLVAPDIVLALNQFDGVHVVVPMIYPGNVACIALGPVERACAWDKGPVEIERASIGVAYDHRHVTGGYVAGFLAALRKALT